MFAVLIVDEEVEVLAQLREVLSRKRYFLTTCHSITTAFEKIDQRPYDLVITANTFSDGSGIDLVEYINRFSYQTRCMVLARKPKYSDRIAAYKKGVDDFLVKPFNINEFWWRFKALCFRQKVKERNQLQLCDSVSVYPDEGLLRVEDKTTIIPKREAEILGCLVQHKNRVVGRDELARWVWTDGEFIPKSVTLDVYIKRIRIKLGEYSNKLQTVRGFGYRIQ
jgi:DNA-binding response OmpR family regulator